MTKHDPLRLALDLWMLGLESGAVIALRVPRLMTGDSHAVIEAQRMVSEKLTAAAVLQWKLVTGELGASAPAVMHASVSHYRKKVRGNRRRLNATGKRA